MRYLASKVRVKNLIVWRGFFNVLNEGGVGFSRVWRVLT